MSKITEFYNTLFNVGEGIGYQTDHGEPGTENFYKKNRVLVHKEDQDTYNFDYHFYSINPIHPTIDFDPQPDEEYKPRIKLANVTSFRNFAIEFDKDDLETQAAKLKKAKPPVSAIIFSGSKSLHTPIALEEEVTQDEYSAIFEAIKQTLLKYDLELDPQCKNANRLTRAPGQIRHWTTVEQKLIKLNGRIPNQVLFDWFEANDINYKDYIFKVKESPIIYDGRGDANDEMRWRAAVSATKHFNGEYQTADQWQPWIFELGKWCKAYDLNESMAILWSERDYSHPDTKAIPTGIKNGYKYGKLSPRTLNLPKVHQNVSNDNMFDGLLDDVKEEIPYDFNIDNYVWIGPDIFLIYPDGNRVRFNTQGFNARFKSQNLNVNDITRKYSGEGYYPNYFINRLSIENNMYNAFLKPNVVLKEGNWSNTEILLRHIFGDQYNLGLEYYWVLRNHPTQPLPALALLGGEDAGKSSLAEHLEMCFKNTKMVDIDQLTQRENSYVKNTQIIVFEESSDSGTSKHTNPAAIANKIKTLVTQCGKKHPIKELYNNAGQCDYFGHIVMLTNDITPIQMKGEATRYWVIEVGKPKKIVDFMKKVEAELPYFLHYLDNEFEPSRTTSKERLWFHPDEYWTLTKESAKTASGSKLYRIIKQVLLEWFKEYEEENYCTFDAKSLTEYLKTHDVTAYNKFEVRDCLVEEFKLKPSDKRRVVTDSLAAPEPNSSGQTTFPVRKMEYYRIDSNFEDVENTEGMKDLDGVFSV